MCEPFPAGASREDHAVKMVKSMVCPGGILNTLNISKNTATKMVLRPPYLLLQHLHQDGTGTDVGTPQKGGALVCKLLKRAPLKYIDLPQTRVKPIMKLKDRITPHVSFFQ